MAKATHGAGTVWQDGDKWRWQGYYIDQTGKAHRPSRTFKTKAEALAFQAQQTEQAEVKKAKKNKNHTMQELFNMWCDDVKAGKIKTSETTRKNSIRNWRAHLLPLLGNDHIKTLSTKKVQRYFEKLKQDGKSTRTIYLIFNDLQKVIKYALDKSYIVKNPISDIDIEKPQTSKKVVNVMTFAEYEKIINNEENRNSYYFPAIMFLAETGLRAEELAIKRNDYHTTENGLCYVVIDKSIVRALKDDDKTSHIILSDNVKTESSARKVPLNIFAQSAIEKQLEYCKTHGIHSQFIFCTKTGEMLDQRNLLRALHTFCNNVDIPIRGLHSLRKLYINHTLKNGITPFDLAKITGHSIQTMYKYYHDIDEDTLQSVANASESRK